MKIHHRHYLLLHPRMVVIISSGRKDKVVNIAPISWITPVSEEPPRLALALDKESFTHELILRYKDFVVNIPPINMVDAIMYSGMVSGREVNKLDTLRIKITNAKKIKAPALEGMIARIECRLTSTFDMGDTSLFIADIIYAEADPDLFNERYGWNIKKASILLHLSGKAFTTCRTLIIAKPEKYRGK